MKSFGILAASALFSALVNAAPVNKRAVVWVTETEIDVVTVPVTMTVWQGPGNVLSTQARYFHHFTSAEAWTTSTPTSSTSSVYVAPTSTSDNSSSAVVAPTLPSTSAYVEPTSSSTSVYVAPTTSSSSSVYVAPTLPTTSAYVEPTSSSTSVYVAPTTSSTSVYVAPTTSSTSIYVAPTTSSTSIYVAPTISSTSVYVAPTTSSTTSSAPAATSSSSSSGSLSGLAASGTSYSGDLTWYEVGLGACGWTNVDGDHIVAISETIFDAYSTGNPNTNPLCGQYVSITGKDGSTYQAKVVDRCTGCAEADLDLSHEFFNTVTSDADGRAYNMAWSWL